MEGVNERKMDGEAETRHTLCVSSLSFSLFFFLSCFLSVTCSFFLSFYLSTGGWRTWMEEWVGSPVVLTAPDRAVLMGADDD